MRTLKTAWIAAALAIGSAWPAMAANLEVMHYWLSSSESAALTEIRKAYEARGGTWKDLPVENYATLREEFAAANADGIPPGALHWVSDATSEQLIAMRAIAPVDAAVQAGWDKVVPDFVWRTIAYDGTAYFAPVGVHVENWMWVNRTVFKEHGLEVPKTWPDLIAAAKHLKAAGIEPIAIGSETWTRDILVRAVLSGTYGNAPDRDALFADWRAFLSSPRLDEAVRIIAELGTFIEPTAEPKSWTSANEDLMAGRAAMYFMGDWAKGDMALAGLTIGEDVTCAVPPGNEWILPAVVDVFAFPMLDDPEIRSAQRLLAETIMDPAVQVAFAAKKGATPARHEVSVADLDPCSAMVTRSLSDPSVQKAKLNIAFPAHGGTRFALTLDRLLYAGDITEEEALATIRGLLDDPEMN